MKKILALGVVLLTSIVLEARTFEIKAWRGETVTALVPDFCELGTVPTPLEIKFGHLEIVMYATYPNSLERRAKYDRVVWQGDRFGEPRIVEVKVPRDAAPGVYDCGMMRVTVVDRVLPEPRIGSIISIFGSILGPLPVWRRRSRFRRNIMPR